MLQLTNIRLILACLALIALVACSTAAPKDSSKSGSDLDAWHKRVEEILQSGWEVKVVNNSLVITRKEPVTYYNPIALPAADSELRKKMIERGKQKESYQITLELVDRLSDEKYRELKAINVKTDKELTQLEDRMRTFASKGDYMPRNPEEHLLYQEYKKSLSTLPYHRLPDLYDAKHSVYVITTRSPWAAFYSTREELECRAVIENIYSYGEVYEGDSLVGWPPYTPHASVAASECFDSQRVYDRYLHKKVLNLN